MRYYSKEIPESGVVINGTTMRFDLLETEDPVLIAELDKCVARGVGGVISITQEQFEEEVKKKASGLQSPSSWNSRRQRQELSANQLVALRAVGRDGDANGQFATPQVGRDHKPRNGFGLGRGNGPAPDPIEVPTAETFAAVFAKPPTAKMSDVKSTA